MRPVKFPFMQSEIAGHIPFSGPKVDGRKIEHPTLGQRLFSGGGALPLKLKPAPRAAPPELPPMPAQQAFDGAALTAQLLTAAQGVEQAAKAREAATVAAWQAVQDSLPTTPLPRPVHIGTVRLGAAPPPTPGDDNIRRFVPEDRREALTGQMRGIAVQLSNGPAIIGESHTRPDARAAVMDMIAAGLVRELFVELGSLHLSELGLEDSPEGGFHGRTATDYLREHAGEDLSTDPVWESLSEGLTWVDAHPNAIPLATLIQTAQHAGVAVYFYDNEPSSNRTSSAALARRNRVAGQEFQRSRTPGHTGTVLLVGSDHLRADHCGGPTRTIQRACGVPPERVYDLSGT